MKMSAGGQRIVLEPVVKPLTLTLFDVDNWVFQQNSAPTHKIQKWLQENLFAFIELTNGPLRVQTSTN